jgi:hypothetical protein
VIDVQIILSRLDNPYWRQQCLESIDGPVRVHVGPCIAGDVTAARMAVWDNCGGDLLSFVDPDDVVMPGAFAACHDQLDLYPHCGGVCTFEELIGVDGKVIDPALNTDIEQVVRTPRAAHHLLVVRRGVYQEVRERLPETPCLHWALAIAAHLRGGLVRVPRVGYQWRIHKDNHSWSRPYERTEGRHIVDALS